MKIEPKRKELKLCQLRSTIIKDKDTDIEYGPGHNFYCEQKYDGQGHAYMRVYRSEDAESYWPFSLPNFYNLFIIVR